MDKSGKISSVIEDHVEGLAILESLDGLLHAPRFQRFSISTTSFVRIREERDSPDVFLLGLTLPGENGNTGSGDSSSGLILGREDLQETKQYEHLFRPTMRGNVSSRCTKTR